THLFMDGGRILKSVKKSYAEHVGSDGLSETVRVLMKEQHKAMFIALRDGQFDDLVDGGAGAKKPSGTMNAPAAAAVVAAAKEKKADEQKAAAEKPTEKKAQPAQAAQAAQPAQPAEEKKEKLDVTARSAEAPAPAPSAAKPKEETRPIAPAPLPPPVAPPS